MPSDITGSEIYNQSQGNFEFEPGPIFSQLCMFDELNRATPRTQSALLQAMEESQVSAARTTHQLPSPFIVVSTQNPIELEGTFPLPEAQLDRFLTRIDLRQPSTESLVKILRLGPNNDTPNLAASSLLDIQAAVHDIAIADDLVRQVAELTTATHSNDNIQFGVSPRGALSIISLAKGFAFLRDQQHVQPLDIQNAVLPCLRHRITLAYHAAGHESCSDDILIEILSAHPIS
jgi:MoxR-like ATPase